MESQLNNNNNNNNFKKDEILMPSSSDVKIVQTSTIFLKKKKTENKTKQNKTTTKHTLLAKRKSLENVILKTPLASATFPTFGLIQGHVDTNCHDLKKKYTQKTLVQRHGSSFVPKCCHDQNVHKYTHKMHMVFIYLHTVLLNAGW